MGKNVKILIAYATKTGTTRECAERLATHFSFHDVTLVVLEKETPTLSDFDAAVIGSNVRANKIHKKVKQFLEENETVLAGMRYALYICCCMSDQSEFYFEKNFASSLMEKSLANLCFGGEIKMERQKGIDKLIMKIVLRVITNSRHGEDPDEALEMPAVIPENIRRLADAVKTDVRVGG